MKYFSLILLLGILPFYAQAQLKISIESGLIFSQYNEVQVPNNDQQQGTRFSLNDDFTTNDPGVFLRVELSYLINQRHTVELTAAPLAVSYQDAKLNNIDFAGSNFSSDKINGRYEFNTYRASYRYRLVQKPKFTFDLGASLLVRDARIALFQDGQKAEDTDLGFVPLVSFELDYAPFNNFSFLLKGDALVGAQGRAEDIFAGTLIDLLKDRLVLKAGYRFIEGGADVDQVYNFAFIHFADLGLVYSFN